MARRALRRLAGEESGMTLVELLNVLVIIGILLLIAVPSYLGLKDRASKSAAKANLRSTIPSVIEYGVDNQPGSQYDPDADPTDSGYTNLSEAFLQSKYDPTLDTSKLRAFSSPDGTSFCVYTWVGAWVAAQAGPSAPITVSLNSAFNPGTCSTS